MLSRAADALRELARTARRAAPRTLRLAALIWAAGAGAAFAGQATFNIGVQPQGMSAITDLAASTGPGSGAITLTWTEPDRRSTTPPYTYDLRVSSLAQVSNTGQFLAAQPLSAFSATPLPSVGPAGAAAGLVVTGLDPGVTYYFALRAQDGTAPPYAGVWNRVVARGWNVSNFAQAGYTAGGPAAVTDLAAAPTSTLDQALLTWTAPATSVRLASFTVVYATISVSDLGGDTTAWFDLAVATRTTFATMDSSNTAESLLVNNLSAGTTIFFGVESADILGQVSPIDVKAAGGATQAKINLQSTIEVTASSGAVSGSIDLSWQEPYTFGYTPPLRYEIKASSVANIDGDVGFSTAPDLSALSAVTIPTPGSGGARVDLPVTGLIPGVTYYFAVSEVDSSTPAIVTHWLRNPGAGLNAGNFAQAAFYPSAPDAITDLAASSATGEGHVTLTWTAPRNRNFVPMASYEVRFGTFSEAGLGGDATAWFNLSASSSVSVAALAPGTTVTLEVGGLYPLSTWYFEVRSTDQRGEVSPIDARATGGLQAQAMPGNDPPATPSGLSATAGLKSASLTWLALNTAEKGLDFAFFRLYRSTQASTGFIQVTTTTALSYLDRPLAAMTTYYYKLAASEGPGGLDSVASSTVSVVPFGLGPQEPYAFQSAETSTTITLAWTPTQRFADGELFLDPSSPASDELLGYKVYRSTDICSPSYVAISTLAVSSTSFTDLNTSGNAYFYRVYSYNSIGLSSGTLTITSLGDQHFMLDDCSSDLVLDSKQASVLTKSSNTLGGDVLIERRRRPEDTGGGVVQSAEFRALLDGVTELPNFHLPSPARVVLHYLTDAGGAPAAQGASGQALPRSAGASSAGSDPRNLGMFWYDGAQFKKLYGRVDTLSQTVEVETPNLGVYQLRSQLRSDGAVFDVSNVSSRVITPNDDGLNDVLIIGYDPGPQDVTPSGVIYDVRGAFVAAMTPGLVPNTLTWDGKMNGRAVTSGVYVYQIKGGGKTFNGTVVVAR